MLATQSTISSQRELRIMLLTYISLRLTENRILLLLIPPRNHGGSRRYVWFYRKKSSKSPAKRANTAVRSTVKVVQLSTHNGNGTLKNKILLETIEKASVKSAPAKEKRRKSTTDKAPKKVTEIPDRMSATLLLPSLSSWKPIIPVFHRVEIV